MLLPHLSHPSWVRGLKSVVAFVVRLVGRSHPSWVRGLKFFNIDVVGDFGRVASFMGAWIEIQYQ